MYKKVWLITTITKAKIDILIIKLKRTLSLTNSSVKVDVKSGDNISKITLTITINKDTIKAFFSGPIYTKVLLIRVFRGIFLSPFNVSNSSFIIKAHFLAFVDKPSSDKLVKPSIDSQDYQKPLVHHLSTQEYDLP